MAEKQWNIIEEVEKLTEENASNFLAPSVYGQVKIKGKFIRDEHGKLVPVLVKTRRQVENRQPGAVQGNREETLEPVSPGPGILNRLQHLLRMFFF